MITKRNSSSHSARADFNFERKLLSKPHFNNESTVFGFWCACAIDDRPEFFAIMSPVCSAKAIASALFSRFCSVIIILLCSFCKFCMLLLNVLPQNISTLVLTSDTSFRPFSNTHIESFTLCPFLISISCNDLKPDTFSVSAPKNEV